ncbi:hypothetical protein P7M41_26265, partial [Vibrio parahaemolyticus]|nr:hypothetical protein [Vibrio parahaemolyticus]
QNPLQNTHRGGLGLDIKIHYCRRYNFASKKDCDVTADCDCFQAVLGCKTRYMVDDVGDVGVRFRRI